LAIGERRMSLSSEDAEWVGSHPSAAMITVGDDGLSKAARVAVSVVDGKLWSSGTADRVRTGRLRRDPRCTLFVFDAGYSWLTLETTVTMLEGAEVPAQTVRLMRQMQGKPTGPLSWFGGELEEDAFMQQMVDEQRLIYEFDVHKSYGMH
jgi:Pyridoxamine 5'-phosphate oxidase